MDEIAPQIALLRQMYMGLDKKSRKAFLASIGHKDSHEERPAGNSSSYSRGTPCSTMQKSGSIS